MTPCIGKSFGGSQCIGTEEALLLERHVEQDSHVRNEFAEACPCGDKRGEQSIMEAGTYVQRISGFARVSDMHFGATPLSDTGDSFSIPAFQVE